MWYPQMTLSFFAMSMLAPGEIDGKISPAVLFVKCVIWVNTCLQHGCFVAFSVFKEK